MTAIPTPRLVRAQPERLEPAPLEGAESAAVRRAQTGDDAAFEILYRRHAPRIYALCLRLEGDAQRAADRLQDVFVRAWERLGSFRGDSAFGTWLHRLAVNVVLADRRAAWRRERRVAAADVDSLPEPVGSGPGDGLDLERAIAALPAGARTVFVLHDVEGYQHREIAALIGIAEGTSKTQLFRARRLLREALHR